MALDIVQPNARVVPSSAVVFVMPVQSAILASYQHVDAHLPYVHAPLLRRDLYTFELARICRCDALPAMVVPSAILECPGVHSVHDMQLSERFGDPDCQGQLVFMADKPVQVFEYVAIARS